MSQLNFPAYEFRIQPKGAGKEIFDDVRKRWVMLTPEEWVRQHVVQWLRTEKSYPASLMAIEKVIKVNTLSKRCDVICYHANLAPLVIVECKSPDVKITQDVFDQAARYNLTIGARYFLLTNGLQHFCCLLDHENQRWQFLEELPEYR
ncbi:MAG TPA: type I restriction enzyme HsdR N-terminal domain-containing protein [Bacteroidia bacterium]|nr:type I restriction enzyme HsdR N-terminal domain-containing protein [Bacteroidia bacterium]